jgi:hypothetical protein
LRNSRAGAFVAGVRPINVVEPVEEARLCERLAGSRRITKFDLIGRENLLASTVGHAVEPVLPDLWLVEARKAVGGVPDAPPTEPLERSPDAR